MKQVEKNTRHCLQFCYFFSFFLGKDSKAAVPHFKCGWQSCCREENNGARHDYTTITSNSLVKEDVPFAAFFINSLFSVIWGLFRGPYIHSIYHLSSQGNLLTSRHFWNLTKGTILIRILLTNSMDQRSPSEAYNPHLVKNSLAFYQTGKLFINICYSPSVDSSQARCTMCTSWHPVYDQL
jgi:hypothetical protein